MDCFSPLSNSTSNLKTTGSKDKLVIRFICECGGQISFDDNQCARCQKPVGFDAIETRFYRLDDEGRMALNSLGTPLMRCSNGLDHDACNWLRPAEAKATLCKACQFNRFIPDLSRDGNLSLWRTLEVGKKRLIFSLMQLGLPLTSRWHDPCFGLFFDFLEDWARDGGEPPSAVRTGYLDGVITINILEAEPVLRLQQQQAAKELYRTVLGHLRHESGHHFYKLAATSPAFKDEFEKNFGSPDLDYEKALNRYYETGPKKDWLKRCISPYASAHPLEDWAETWGHYLHIYDTLETGFSFSGYSARPETPSFDNHISVWGELSRTLNEMNRSMGMDDPYPFTINEKVKDKLRFIDTVISGLKIR
ncbi:putative zinc-binding peptidase [Pseudomonadales bacterium]|nr:putative zinc-binding peptidase [Pseudomonadales bacterium]